MDILIQNILNVLLSQIALGVYAILLLLLVILLVRSVIRNEHATAVALDAMKERIKITKKDLASDETAAGEMTIANALAVAHRAEEEAKRVRREAEEAERRRLDELAAARLAAEAEERRRKKEAIAAKQAEKEQKRKERLEKKAADAELA